MYTAQVSKFASSLGHSGWGQVHDFTPEESDKVFKRGRLIATICMEGFTGSQLEGINVGREILTRLHEEYYGELVRPTFDSLKHSVNLVADEFSNDLTKTFIGALCLIENKIFFASTTNITGFVLRRGNLAQILNSTRGLTSGSGEILMGDSFLLGTNAFFATLSEGIIKASLEKSSAVAVIESLAPFIYQRQQTSKDGIRGVAPNITLPASKNSVAVCVKILTKDSFSHNLLIQQNSFESSNTQMNLTSDGGIKTKLVTLIDALIQKLPERKISVGPDLSFLEERRNKRRMIFVGILLLILLLVSIVFGVIQKKNKQAIEKYEDRLLTSQHQLEEAKTLATINQSRARELLLSAKGMLNEIKNEGVKDNRIEQTLEEINNNIGSIAGIYEVTPELYLDLGLLSDGFVGQQLSVSEGRMLILDQDGRLVSVTLESKKTKVLAGPESLKNAKSVAVYSDRNFVLTENEVVEVLGQGTKTVIEKDWDNAFGLHAFAANIYILDKGKNEVIRHAGGSNGFGSGNNWFAPGIKVDLANIESWAIDGSIWFLTTRGEIEKYTNGNPQNFVMSGLEGNLTGAVDIFVDDQTEFLYVLDQENGRIIVLEKNGNYKAEYISDQIKQATKLIVSEEEKKIILLTADKLYSIEIKHL